jgi:hypothetical protein
MPVDDHGGRLQKNNFYLCNCLIEIAPNLSRSD